MRAVGRGAVTTALKRTVILLVLMPVAAIADEVTLTAGIGGDGNHTRYVAFLAQKVEFRIFSITDPYRIVIDLPEVGIQVPTGMQRGLVASTRSGLIATGKSRIVIDLTEPAVVEKSELLPPQNGLPARLIIELAKSTHKAFAEQSKAPPPLQPAEAPKWAAEENVTGKKPLIVVDPGHGGIDAGALGRTTAAPEKDVTIDFCKTLMEKLQDTGKYRLIITRSNDVFVALDDRVQIAANAKADLLISIHADALDAKRLGIKSLQEVRGGTVYTLSEEASDEQAKIIAQNENKADLQAGVGSEQSVPPAVAAEIMSILNELGSREKKNRSLALANYLIEHLKSKLKFNIHPHRSANLRVLKAAGVPAVLIELGYLSNTEDEKLLTSPEWRAKTAAALAEAVNAFMTDRMGHIPL